MTHESGDIICMFVGLLDNHDRTPWHSHLLPIDHVFSHDTRWWTSVYPLSIFVYTVHMIGYDENYLTHFMTTTTLIIYIIHRICYSISRAWNITNSLGGLHGLSSIYRFYLHFESSNAQHSSLLVTHCNISLTWESLQGRFRGFYRHRFEHLMGTRCTRLLISQIYCFFSDNHCRWQSDWCFL